MAKFSLHNLFCLLLVLLALSIDADGAPKKKSSKTSSSSAAKPRRSKAEPQPPAAPLAPGELALAAESAILIDGPTGEVLYSKNPDAVEFPASATKILTALLVIEAGDLEKDVVIEIPDTKVEPSALEFKPGETYKRKDLLYALLLKSANDVALALARDNAGSVEAFAEKMTLRAAELGATSSHFTNPHGLHNPHHYVTAIDLACIARAAMNQPLFRQVVGTWEHQLQCGDACVKLRNHNKLLPKFPGCTGIKTGYTRPAQQVLVSSASRQDHEIIAVVMHTNRPGIWDDSRTLLLHGFEKLGLAEAGDIALHPPPPAASPPGSHPSR